MTIAARIRNGVFTSDARNACAVPWKPVWMLSGSPSSALALSIDLTASPSDVPGARLNETVTTGNCPWWLMASGALAVSMVVNAPSGTAPPPADRRKTLSSSHGALLERRLRLEHDAVLVQLREHGRDLPLAEGVVEGVVEHLRRDAQARRRGPIEDHARLEALALLVARDVAQLGQASAGDRRSAAPTAPARAASGSSRLYWYCVRLTRSSTVRSWTGCMNSVMPSTFASSGCRRRMISLALALALGQAASG